MKICCCCYNAEGTSEITPANQQDIFSQCKLEKIGSTNRYLNVLHLKPIATNLPTENQHLQLDSEILLSL